VFFAGFAAAAQLGGRITDKYGARPAIVLGCLIAAAGFYLWGRKVTGLSFDDQWKAIAVAGAGLGLVLGPVSTDALNRAPGAGYGEVTGITQTVRNLGASLGLAIMGSLFVGVQAGPAAVADSTQTIAWIMAGIMLAAFVVAKVWLPRGRVEAVESAAAAAAAA
jgi:MFS family permease